MQERGGRHAQGPAGQAGGAGRLQNSHQGRRAAHDLHDRSSVHQDVLHCIPVQAPLLPQVLQHSSDTLDLLCTLDANLTVWQVQLA